MWDNQFTCWPSWFRKSWKNSSKMWKSRELITMWTISGPSEAHSVKTTRRFCFMRTEPNLCEYRPFHKLLLSGFGQIIQYHTISTSEMVGNMLKPQFHDVTRFFQCHSRYFSYSFLVSTSTQSWRSEGPQGPAFGDTIFGSNGKKQITWNVVFPGTSPEKCWIFKDVY